MRYFILLLVFAGLSFGGLHKLDYVLLQAVKENKQVTQAKTFKVKSAGRDIAVREVKILTKDGKVKVVNLSGRSLQDLMNDPDIVYIEAPRPVKLLNDIVRDSSYGVWGTGNATISIQDPGYGIWGYVYSTDPNASFTVSNNCTVVPNTNYFYCSGLTDISVSSTGNFRLVVGGPNLESNMITGSSPVYLVGTKSWNTLNYGTGVIVGVIDSGINLCHPAFLDINGNTRIKYFGFITDQTTCSSKGGIYDPNTQICEFDETVINQKIAVGDCNYDPNGHGTHVAGTAAGSDLNNLFGIGIALNADLVVFTDFANSWVDTFIIKGLEWIKQKAQQLNKPAVVNMSLGFHDDPHDGSGLVDRKVDEISGIGFIVVVAQSNEGKKPIHAYTTSTTDTISISVPELRDFQNQLIGYGAQIKGWYKNPSQWKIEVCEPGTNNCVGASSGNDMPNPEQIGNTGCSAQVFASRQQSPLNDDGEFLINIDCLQETTLQIKLTQICGDVARVDMWDLIEAGIFQSRYAPDPFYNGYMFTVASPGTAKRAITVGAVNSRPDPIMDQNVLDTFPNLGKIANFSSRGPTRDGRIKPNVVAGGAFVISADASYPDNLYKPNAGTSMATPVVTGLVALYFQNNPNATPEDVKLWLTSNAVQDVQEPGMTYPNVAYGYGKAVWAETVSSGGSQTDPTVNISIGQGVGSCQAQPSGGESDDGNSEGSLPPGGGGNGGGGGGCAGSYTYLADLITAIISLFASMILRRIIV